MAKLKGYDLLSVNSLLMASVHIKAQIKRIQCVWVVLVCVKCHDVARSFEIKKK